MDTKNFFKNADELVQRCMALLKGRNDKYNFGDDRLSNFKRAAEMLHNTPLQAAAGHASKHIICLNDMIASGAAYPKSVWEEEIMDCMNYLMLQYNIIQEMEDDLICAEPQPKQGKKNGTG